MEPKRRLIIIPLTVCLLAPEFYVLLLNETSRFCPANLLNYLIADVTFTTLMLGFCFILCQMDPLVYQIKIAFHIFGVLDAAMGIAITIALASTNASTCRDNTTTLYYACLILAILHIASLGLVVFLTPFWVANSVWALSVLNPRQRRGVCYEPVKCCTCLWHV
ncbi:uncharacterized protein TRIADDRAFT_57336 [Trichoplax adhaerens]|uniref:G-protein coupled receptors family 1 profile domain-containing protein n=1 Tax=Trichoplax adhaerens TaxID=10228 RepID=B3RZ58_TRIAD|nr:hypothetical protein TRIADDRAFT_57336 [Trichoplax adhaerens]EDV24144.1 hypothetical protein TRIADDRAFT_57336 [Trichoplax adhaerens]|eukprot:XP_002113670.1 hypothetical protein TRIADDRAFT_57336 [Trichoplax adhaerens]